MQAGFHQAAQGLVKWQVIDARTGRVVREQPGGFQKNLILNNGMNEVAARSWCNCFTHASAGLGTTPTNVDSGATNGSQAGTTVSLTGGAFTFGAGDVGNMIKWTSGSEARITAFGSGASVTVDRSQTVGSGHFVVYNTNQTGLAIESKRTSTYLTSAGACGSTLVGNVLQHLRTYDFSAESGTVFYTEIGLAWASSGANTHFSRFLLSSAAQVDSGQQLRVVYQLNLTLTPSTSNAKSALISGWPVTPSVNTDGVEQIQRLGMSSVFSTGATATFDNGGTANEPSGFGGNTGVGILVWVSPSATGLSAFNAAPAVRTANATSVVSTAAAYNAFDFYRDKTGLFTTNDANRTDLRSMGVGNQNSSSSILAPADGTTLAFVFAQVQAKTSAQTLTLTFRYSWSRVLA